MKTTQDQHQVNRTALIFLAVVLAFTGSVEAPAQRITKPNEPGPFPGLAVNTFTGNLVYQRTDLTIPGRGISLNITFTYNSGRSRRDWGFGHGWSFTYGMAYRRSGDTIFIDRDDGQRDPFVLNGSQYLAPKGVYDVLKEYQVGKFLLTTKYGFRYFFDDETFKFLTALEDRNGNKISLIYDNWKLISVLDPSGRSLNFSWSDGHLKEITDPNAEVNRPVKFQYDDAGNLIGVTDPLGNGSTYEYGEWQNLTAIVNPRGTRLTVYYNENNAVSGVICSAGNTKKTFDYNHQSLKTTVTEYLSVNQRITGYFFDNRGRVVQIHYPDNSSAQYAWDESDNISAFTDENGYKTNYSYDGLGNLLRETDYLGHNSSYTYTRDFNLLDTSTDKDGHKWIHTYDLAGNELTCTNPAGASEHFTYDQYGNRLTRETGNGKIWQYSYNAYGYLTGTTDPLGNTEAFGYDGAGNLNERTDQNGNKNYIFHDLLNRPVRYVDQLGFERLVAYDQNGNILTKTQAGGIQYTYQYDALDRLVRSTGPLGYTTEYEYDEAGNVMAETDANGGRTVYLHDGRNRLIKVTDPAGFNLVYTYDLAGNRTGSTDKRNNTTNYVWDGLGRLTGITDPAGFTELYGYDLCGNRIAFTDKNGKTATYSYDHANRLVRITDPAGGETVNEWDPEGNLVSVTDPGGMVTRYSYDPLGRLIRKTDAGGYQCEYAYDPAGNRISDTDENGNVRTYAYDAAGRIVRSTNANGHFYSYTYDSEGNRISQTNPNGVSVQYEYDALNRLVKVTSPMGYQTLYQYDGLGNMTRRTDPGSRQTHYTYDALNRLILTAYPAGSVQRVYDANGNLLQMFNMGVGLGDITERTYDEADRLKTEKIRYGPFEKTVSYNYDPEGNILKVTDPDGKEIRYAYDDLNQPKTITGPFTDVAGISYNASGLYAGIDFPNGERNQSVYDYRNRLLSKETRDATNAVLFRYDYKYDNAGQVLEVSRNGIPEAHFDYDGDGRLMNANYPFSAKNILYGYDATGNRMMKSDKGAVTGYVYNAENRVVRQVLPDQSAINYAYDNNGNVVQTVSNWGTVNYGYDYENRLVSINYPAVFGSVLTYYSPEGNRLARFERGLKIYYYPTLLGNIIEMDENGTTLKRLNPGISQADVTGNVPDIIYHHWDGWLNTSFFTGHSIVASVTFDYFGEVLESSGNMDKVDAALYWTGNKVDWDPVFGAELIGIGYAPDIGQHFGNTSFEPWNMPDDPFTWLEDLKGVGNPADVKPADGSAPVAPGAEKKKNVEFCGFRENIWETTGSIWVYVGCYADKDYLPQKRLIFKFEKKQQQKEVTVTCWLEKGHPGHHMDSERTDTGRTRLESYKPPFYETKKSGQLQEWPDQETRDKEGARLLGEKNKK